MVILGEGPGAPPLPPSGFFFFRYLTDTKILAASGSLVTTQNELLRVYNFESFS